MKLANRIAVVTGGGRGIGAGIALKLAETGADIVIATKSVEPAGEVVKAIAQLGRNAAVIQTDVSDFDSVKAMIATALAQFGRIDILVNNAGGSARGKMSLFCDSAEDTWDAVLGTNLMGVFHTCRAVLGHMLERGCGSIVNIGSVAGMIGLASQVDYSAAKGAVIAFTKALAKSTGFGRFGEPADIANLVTFLASDEAQFITGQNYPVRGVMNLGFAHSILG